MRCKYNQILFGASDLGEFFQLAVVQFSVFSWQLAVVQFRVESLEFRVSGEFRV